MGSKNRHSKELLPIILNNRQQHQWYVEPFVGGANMIDKVVGLRIGSDSNKYLIALLKAVQSNINLPHYISEDEYRLVKNNKDNYPDWYVGFVGFCCSFGGKWFGGFARNVKKNNLNADILNMTSRNYCAESKRNLDKQSEKLKDIIFKCEDYMDLDIPENSIIYCDPPYEGTTKYKDYFNHENFWEWCRIMSIDNNVFISEYNAPKDFRCIWSKKTLSNFSLQNDIDKNRIEKLFVYNAA